MNLDKRLLGLARKSRVPLILTIGLGLAAGILTVLQAGYLSRIIDQVFLDGYSIGDVTGLLSILLGIILLRAALVWSSEVSANAIAVRMKTLLRRALVSRLLDLGPAYTRGERSGELTNTLVEGVEALDAYYSQYLPQLVLAALVPLTFLAVVFPLDPLSGLVLALTAPLIPIFMVLIGNYSKTLTGRQWRVLSRMSAYFLDIIQGLTTLKTLGRSQAQVTVIADVSERYRQVTMSVLRVTFLSALVLEMVATLSTAVVAVEVGLRLLYGRLAFEQALFILLLAPEFYLPLRMLGTRFHAGMSGVEAAQRIFEVLEEQTSDRTGLIADGERVRSSLKEADLHLQKVAYTYPDGRQALVGVDLHISQGEVVALVGPSGGGKTTVADLLLQFVQPISGALLVAEVPISDFEPDIWRSQVGWVSQEPYLINASVAANIRMGKPDASEAEVVRAAEQAHAHAFIRALPDGYDTLVGERGAHLSAGQVQRIALARAFLKDAPLLVLDEATANLDAENEALIGAAMARLFTGRTALVIAHRLQTVLSADRIVVLDGGQVVSQGTHSELIAEEGLYRRLVHASQDELVVSDADLIELDQLNEPDHDPGEIVEPLDKDNPPTSVRSSFLRLIQLIAPLKGQVALSVILGVAAIASSVGLMSTSAYIISAAALHPSIAELQLAIVGVRAFGISRGVFRYLERYVSHQVTFRLLARFRIWFYRSLEPLAPARLMRFRSGDLLTRILGDIETLENFYVRALAPPLVAILMTLLVGLFLAIFSPALAFTLLAFILAAGVGVPWLGRWLGREPGAQLVGARAAIQAAHVDGIQGMADLIAYNQQRRVLGVLNDLDRRLVGAQRRMARINGLGSALSGLLMHTCMWSVLVLGITLVHSGQMDGVYLAVVTLAALTCFEALLPLPGAALYLERDLQAAGRLFELVDSEPVVREPAQPCELSDDLELEVQDLYFRYPLEGSPGATHPWTLAGIDFTLRRGQRLAVVGPSGAGKSTLVNLLLRFWDYEEGRILIAGRDFRACQGDQIRERMAIVSQNTFLFNASVHDNLRLARPSASQSELVWAAQQARLHDVLEDLPEGYDTWIGEGGAALSGGERQRLAVARALLRDSPLLILDEPTANLDALTERAVMETLQRLMVGRTTLLITHRLIGMGSMDEILVLDGGRVVERGGHADLLAAGGLYRRLWDFQNQWLVE